MALLKRMESGEATLTDRLMLAEVAPEEYAKLQAKNAPSEAELFERRRQQAMQDQSMRQSSQRVAIASNRAAYRAQGGW